MFKNLSITKHYNKISVNKPIKLKVINNINKIIDKYSKIKHTITTTKNIILNKKTVLTTVSNLKYKKI